MQSVLVKNDAHIRKRDLKYKTKPKRAQQAEGGSIIDQIFQPSQTSFKGATPAVAVDCEMVQTLGGDALARVSIVNYNGHTIYDKFVRPQDKVTDYRTWVSGVTPQNLKEENGAITFIQAKKEVHDILNTTKLIIGHSLQHDFKSMQYDLPEFKKTEKIRDVAKYAKYKSSSG